MKWPTWDQAAIAVVVLLVLFGGIALLVVPEVIVARERSTFEKRWVQLSEIADFGDRAGWSSEPIHD